MTQEKEEEQISAAAERNFARLFAASLFLAPIIAAFLLYYYRAPTSAYLPVILTGLAGGAIAALPTGPTRRAIRASGPIGLFCTIIAIFALSITALFYGRLVLPLSGIAAIFLFGYAIFGIIRAAELMPPDDEENSSYQGIYLRTMFYMAAALFVAEYFSPARFTSLDMATIALATLLAGIRLVPAKTETRIGKIIARSALTGFFVFVVLAFLTEAFTLLPETPEFIRGYIFWPGIAISIAMGGVFGILLSLAPDWRGESWMANFMKSAFASSEEQKRRQKEKEEVKRKEDEERVENLALAADDLVYMPQDTIIRESFGQRFYLPFFVITASALLYFSYTDAARLTGQIILSFFAGWIFSSTNKEIENALYFGQEVALPIRVIVFLAALALAGPIIFYFGIESLSPLLIGMMAGHARLQQAHPQRSLADLINAPNGGAYQFGLILVFLFAGFVSAAKLHLSQQYVGSVFALLGLYLWRNKWHDWRELLVTILLIICLLIGLGFIAGIQ